MVKIFAHGPSNGTINFFDDRTILLDAENIRPNTMVEGRILFPNSFIENKKEVIDKDMFDTIMAEEESFIQKEENKLIRKEKNKKISNILSPITIILAAILGFFGIRKTKYNTEVYEKELGKDMLFLPPMINSILVNSWFTGNSIPASLYSLAYKGYIEIEDYGHFNKKYSKKDIEDFKISKLNKNKEDLLSHEVYLLDWLFNDVATSDFLTSEDIYKYVNKNSFKFQKASSELYKLAKKDLKDLGLKDDSKVSFGTLLIVIGSLFIPLALFNIIGAGNIIDGLVDILIFAILLVIGISLINKKSDLGQTQYKKLIKFKEDVLKNKIDIVDEEYLITAMALNIPMENLKQYKDNFSNQTMLTNNWIYWYFLINSSGNNVFANSISSSSDTGSFGSGGGFSGGGGGGAGGGGAGGF